MNVNHTDKVEKCQLSHKDVMVCADSNSYSLSKAPNRVYFTMCRFYTHILMFTVLLLAPLTAAPVEYQLSKSGYIQSIQAKEVAALLSELGSTYSVCQNYRHELVAAIEDLQIDTGDIVISVLLPGGLLYFTQKKLRLLAMESDLDDIEKEIDVLEAVVVRLSDDRQLARNK